MFTGALAGQGGRNINSRHMRVPLAPLGRHTDKENTNGSRYPAPVRQRPHRDRKRDRRLVTETKASIKTSEFWLTIAAIVGILVSAAVINGGDTGGTDEFIGRQAWLYVAILAGAYSIGRGLAKSGSNEPLLHPSRW